MRRSVSRSFVLAAALSSPALALDFVVTEYTDDVLDFDPGCTADHCTLREAVIAANAATDLDRILLSAGVYALTIVGTNEDLAADGDLDVEEDSEIIGVGAGITVLDANGLGEAAVAAQASGLDFTLRGVTIRNSDVNALVLGTGTHTIEDCEFRDNGATSSDSGIRTSISSIVTLRRVTIAGNPGRGMTTTQGTTTIENSTFSGNGGRDLVVNSAVQFTCSHCTVADSADSDFEVLINDSVAQFSNSIIAGDCGYLNAGSIDSLGGNVESPSQTCDFDEATDLSSEPSAGLQALGDYGGQTRTMDLDADSPALGNGFGLTCLSSDQRGVARPTSAHAACDAGAVERIASPVATPIFHDGFLQGDPEAWSDAVGD
jgi:hypothetical protein